MATFNLGGFLGASRTSIAAMLLPGCNSWHFWYEVSDFYHFDALSVCDRVRRNQQYVGKPTFPVFA